MWYLVLKFGLESHDSRFETKLVLKEMELYGENATFPAVEDMPKQAALQLAAKEGWEFKQLSYNVEPVAGAHFIEVWVFQQQ